MISHLVKHGKKNSLTQGEIKFSASLDGPFEANNLWAGYLEVGPDYLLKLQGGRINDNTESQTGMSLYFDSNLADGDHALEIGDNTTKTSGHYYQFIKKDDGAEWLYFYPAETGSISITFNQKEQIMTGSFKFIVKDLQDKNKKIDGTFSIKGFDQTPTSAN